MRLEREPPHFGDCMWRSTNSEIEKGRRAQGDRSCRSDRPGCKRWVGRGRRSQQLHLLPLLDHSPMSHPLQQRPKGPAFPSRCTRSSRPSPRRRDSPACSRRKGRKSRVCRPRPSRRRESLGGRGQSGVGRRATCQGRWGIGKTDPQPRKGSHRNPTVQSKSSSSCLISVSSSQFPPEERIEWDFYGYLKLGVEQTKVTTTLSHPHFSPVILNDSEAKHRSYTACFGKQELKEFYFSVFHQLSPKFVYLREIVSKFL